jgi:hypothetical protein
MIAPSFDDSIRAMHLTNAQDELWVKDCIAKYAQPDTLCQTVTWVIYRIVNIFKAIFGQSDWQIAESKVSADLKIQFRVLHHENPQNELEAKIRRTMESNAEHLSSFLLEQSLLIKEGSFHSEHLLDARDTINTLQSLQRNTR